ncbi:hypothetical protein H0G86_011872 [Trichoderma simmonsii]|uniref:Uncharacterized protein n=1 Tax=Trichoderma simmonsii TaxID=1491479 RepID=A0A8G0PKN3_9HYPO|nr:hypothetical protein H0G86_011872 [Trichoderma simmonsii]
MTSDTSDTHFITRMINDYKEQRLPDAEIPIIEAVPEAEVVVVVEEGSLAEQAIHKRTPKDMMKEGSGSKRKCISRCTLARSMKGLVIR